MPIDYTSPLYPIRQAAQAAGFEVNTLRSYYQRGHFKVIGGEAAKARGVASELNLLDIMNIAVAKRLMDLGVHPADAFDAGTAFAHSGSGGRLPGHVFDQREHGFTALVWHSKTRQARIFATDDGLDFSQLFAAAGGGRANPVVILVNDVEREVFSALEKLHEEGSHVAAVRERAKALAEA